MSRYDDIYASRADGYDELVRHEDHEGNLGRFLLGALGTLIGAGGGFMMMPILLLLYPEDSPELLTSISLAAVCVDGNTNRSRSSSANGLSVRP